MSEIAVLLVVPDERSDSLGTALETHDGRLTVERVRSRDAALAAITEHDVDCVVATDELPGDDGLDLLSALTDVDPALPAILAPKNGSEELAARAVTAGLAGYHPEGPEDTAGLAERIVATVEDARTRESPLDAYRRLAELADRTDDILYMVTGDWSDLLFVNAAYEEIWGLPLDDLAADPRSFLEHVHPEDRELARASMMRLQDGESHTTEYRVVQPDGTVKWVRGESQPILNADGAVERIAGSVRDITEYKQRERDLAELKERYQIYVETASDVITVLSDAGIITYQSPSVSRVLGYEPEAMVGDNVFKYVHPDDRERVELRFEELATAEVDTMESVEFQARHADGTWVWLEAQGTNTAAASIGGFVVTTRDISERKAAEQALAREADRLAAFSIAFPDVAFIADSNGLVHDVLAGQHSVSFTQQAPGELRGERVTDVLPEWLAEEFLAVVGAAIETDEPRRHEFSLDSDGTERWFEARVEPLPFRMGDEEAAIWVARDITTQKSQQRELAAKNERLDEFAEIVSHDLRNPLNVAQGRLGLLREQIEDEDALETVMSSLDRMERIIDDVLWLARRGREIGETEQVGLESAVRGAWTVVAPSETTATLTVGEDLGRIEADRDRLRQLLENVLSNSLDHAGPGVEVRVERTDQGFAITDDGPGIDEEERSEVFAVGYTTGQDGTGIGLRIIERVAEAHGWTVDITESDAGGVRIEFSGVTFVD